MIETFLHPLKLSQSVSQPVHILINRKDGKSQDYCVSLGVDAAHALRLNHHVARQYIEVDDISIAHKILQTKQGLKLGDTPRARPCTITLSNQSELVDEVGAGRPAEQASRACAEDLVQLRPADPGELYTLLQLCQVSLAQDVSSLPPSASPSNEHRGVSHNGKGYLTSSRSRYGITGYTDRDQGRYLKSRYAPFWHTLSILSKMSGRDSPIFWDMLRGSTRAGARVQILTGASADITAGIIASLAKSLGPHIHSGLLLLQARISPPTPPTSADVVGPTLLLEPRVIHPTVQAINEKVHRRLAIEQSDNAQPQNKVPDSGCPRRTKSLSAQAELAAREASRAEWIAEDAEMFDRFAAAFETLFGFPVFTSDGKRRVQQDNASDM